MLVIVSLHVRLAGMTLSRDIKDRWSAVLKKGCWVGDGGLEKEVSR